MSALKTQSANKRESAKWIFGVAKLGRKLGVKIKPPNIQFYGW